MIRWVPYSPSTFADVYDWRIVHNLRHVAFMAWLIECRDQRDASIMRELTVAPASHYVKAYVGTDELPEWTP